MTSAQTSMRAIVVDTEGNLVVDEVPTPAPASGEVLVRIEAAGINRADLLQRQGLYPPRPASPT